MPPAVIVAAIAVAAAVPLLWWSVSGARDASRGSVALNLSGGKGPTDLRQVILNQSASQRAVRPAVGMLAERARRLTPAGLLQSLERRVRLAGSPDAWPMERVLAAKLLLCVAGVFVGLFVFSARGTLLWALVALGIVALGYFTPDLLLYNIADKRQKAMKQELPDTLDQMTICVEAGLGFESAMARAARSGIGELARELRRTLQEIQIGIPRGQALRNLLDRADVDDLKHFVLAVLQAESYGVPIAQVLRIQAGELRVKRRQRAEEQAMKIPIKVLFPLVFCIMPTLFIVLLGPAAVRIAESL